MSYSGYFDGAARPNPGEIGMGVSIVSDQQEVDWGYAYKPFGTNNEAEYLSLILLLRQALHFGVTSINCFGDSQLVIKQVNGEWSVSKNSLKKLNRKVLELASRFDSVSFNWIARKKNKRADELSRIAVDNKSSGRKYHGEKEITQAIAPVNKVVLTKPKEKITVRNLKNGDYLIVEPDQTSLVSISTMSCTCGTFIINKKCRHINTLLGCKKQA